VEFRTIQYIDPMAARNMTVTQRTMLKVLNQKENVFLFGFLITSHIRLGSQKVVGANPIAPKKPIKSPKNGRVTATKQVKTT